MTGAEFLDLAVTGGFIMVILAVGMTVIRIWRGPSMPDRVVGLDTATVAIVAFCGLMAIRNDETAFLDVAIVLALVGFLATVALARFAERRVERTRASGQLSDSAFLKTEDNVENEEAGR